ncbi:MAG: protein-disulfide reductase DsbD family protein [Saprospiraceae bacterium]|nr:protein-disulfide reductase DsbD family protein [Saprospiraceae bacterium]
MRIFSLFLLSLISSFAVGQIETPVTWTLSQERLSETEFMLTFQADLDEGWYVYSQNLEDGGPIPTSFYFEENTDAQIDEKPEEIGKPKSGFDAMFDMNVTKYANQVTFKQKVTISNSTSLTGYLTYMTCDDEKCLPPTDEDFSFDLTIAAEKAQEKPTKQETSETTPAIENEDAVEETATEKEEETVSGFVKPVKWFFEQKQIDENTFELISSTEIDEGWYMYSQTIPEGGPPSTFFEITVPEGAELIGGVEESGNVKTMYDKVFDMDLVKFKKVAIFTQKIKTSQASGEVPFYIEYVSCNDKMCLNPTWLEISFDLSKGNYSFEEEEEVIADIDGLDLSGTPVDYKFDHSDEDLNCDSDREEKENSKSLFLIFLAGMGGGLIALLTPCVFPMIPITVGFFTKKSPTKAKGIKNAIIYGLSIIVIYVFLGLAFTMAFGADTLNLMSTNVYFNLFFAFLFIVFALSFFGFFEITLPSSWGTKADAQADKGGILGIFFMAFTLALVSFSCTGPVIGTLLVETATGSGPVILGRIPVGPLMGMLGFSTALALPFALFAAFPSWLNSLPTAGGWMSSVKVVLGFIEIALAMKFISVADLTMGWKIMPYELFLSIWFICALCIVIYLFGKIKFPHDSPIKKFSNTRRAFIGVFMVATVYLLMGFKVDKQSETFDTPDLLSGLAPPAGHSYIFPKHCPLNLECYKDFAEAQEVAKAQNKPIFIDFTGHGCVNCRKMEDKVWGEDEILPLIRDEYVLVSLYVDERKELEEPYVSKLSGKKMRNVGNKWADFQAIHFETNSQPYYVLVAPMKDGSFKILNQPTAYDEDVDAYREFLECGIRQFEAIQ